MTTVFGLVISKLKFKSKYKGMTYPEFSFIVVPIKLGFPTLSLPPSLSLLKITGQWPLSLSECAESN